MNVIDRKPKLLLEDFLADYCSMFNSKPNLYTIKNES
jgi:hypothetical protein